MVIPFTVVLVAVVVVVAVVVKAYGHRHPQPPANKDMPSVSMDKPDVKYVLKSLECTFLNLWGRGEGGGGRGVLY